MRPLLSITALLCTVMFSVAQTVVTPSPPSLPAPADSAAQITDTLATPPDTLGRPRPALRFNDRHLVNPTFAPDTADVTLLQKKNFWRAAGETFGLNMALWAFDRYVLKGHYAYISWETIKANFKHGFEWDDDHLHTNMFDHPYNGSLFFNAGRSNGFNFWQSELFAIGGSAMWEMCMEREWPSTNDIIATPIGGAALGEVFYRTTDLIIDDRTTGGERLGREAAVFVLNPMRGLTRIFSGRAWRHSATTGRQYGIPPISIDVSAGARMMALWDNDEGAHAGACAEIKLEYGDKYEENTREPYDYFSFLMELQAMKSQPLLSRVEIMGRLLSKEIFTHRHGNLNVGLYQHFDFFDSDTIRPERDGSKLIPCAVPYKLASPASLGGGAIARYVPSPSVNFEGFVHINALILGGVLTDFYRDYHRNYNWGSGFAVKAGAETSLLHGRLLVRAANQFYRLYTWQGDDEQGGWSVSPGVQPNVQGDRSNSTFNHFETSVSYSLLKRLYLTLGMDMYVRNTHYYRLRLREGGTEIWGPSIQSKQIGFHLMLTYRI